MRRTFTAEEKASVFELWKNGTGFSEIANILGSKPGTIFTMLRDTGGIKPHEHKGNCYDNAPMESFWGTLKNESLSHYRFNNRDEAISVIREYIEIFYNRQRRHSRLGNISPAAFREKYHQMAA